MIIVMDSSATVNHDHLHQYMVNFNPVENDYISGDLVNTKENINFFTRTTEYYRNGRRLKICATIRGVFLIIIFCYYLKMVYGRNA